MHTYRQKPIIVETFTFDDLVGYGRTQVNHLVNGMPWSFNFEGHPITHENDDCYLIPTPEGTQRFERGDVLVKEPNGEIHPYKADVFAALYEPVGASV